MIKDNKKVLNMLCLIITMLVSFLIPSTTLAREFPENITGIYEVRDVTRLSGFVANGYGLRAVAGAPANGYYLSNDTDTQFLAYKVGEYDASTTYYNYALICTLFGSASPASNSYTATIAQTKPAPQSCVRDNSWSEGIKAGVAAIINSAKPNSGLGYVSNGLQDYYDAEIAINWFLYQKLGNPCNIDKHQCGIEVSSSENKIKESSVSTELLNVANVAYDRVTKLTTTNFSVAYPENKVLTYSDAEEIWKSERIKVVGLDKFSLGSTILDATLIDENGKTYPNYVYLTSVDLENNELQLGVCNSDSVNGYCKEIENFEPLGVGKYTVKVTIGGKETYEVAQNYSCGSGFQTVTPTFTNTVEPIEANAQATFTFEIEEKTGSLTIRKVDEDGAGVVGATITIIGKDVDYKNTVILAKVSKKTLNGLKYGTYTVKEYKAPDGYVIDENSYEVTIGEDNPNETVTIKNKEAEPEKFKFSLIKVDEAGDGISGADFTIDYGNETQIVESISETGITSRYVEVGQKICIKETSAPKGYKKMITEVCFELDEDGKILLQEKYDNVQVFKKSSTRYGIKITNMPVDKSVTYIKKIDATTNKAVEGAKLKLTDKDGNVKEEWITTMEPYAISGLDVGTYYIEEIEAPEGYSLNKTKQELKVTSISQVQTVEFKNTPNVKVPDTLSSVSKIFIVLGVSGMILGGLLIYKNKFSKGV